MTPVEHTVNGRQAFVAAPTGAANGKAIIYCSGTGENAESFWTAGDKAGVEAALDAAGYHVAGIEAHGDNWGNDAGVADYVALYEFLLSDYAITGGVGILAQSMGGLPGLNVIAGGQTLINAYAGIYPACNLLAAWEGSFTAPIRSAYGIALDGSDYATLTDGSDPVLHAPTLFTGCSFRFYASYDDTLVPRADHSDVMADVLRSSALGLAVVPCTGNHGDASHFQPADLVTFFDRHISPEGPMATGLSSASCASILDALCNATSYSVSEVWIKLHVGDPGAAGTSNAATETTRKQASFAAASGATITSDGALTWTNVAANEDYTHFTAWTASTAGTFLFSGTCTANAVELGDTFTVSIGDLDLSLTPAS